MAIININDNWYPIIDDESPNKTTFDVDGSKSFITFLVKQTDLLKFTNEMLGYAQLKNNSYVTRKIPCSHPIFPWQYAFRLSQVDGFRPNGRQLAEEIKFNTSYKNIEVETPRYSSSYEYYKITVEFRSRDYMIYTDDQLKPHVKENQEYAMPYTEPSGKYSEYIDTFTDRAEYTRYTNFQIEPYVELMTYGGGNYFCKRETVPAGVAQEFPISMDNGGNNYLKICKVKILWNWFFVPYEMCLNNQIWIDAYSKINKNQIYFFESGTLLFEKAEVKKYQPYYPFDTINLTATSTTYDYFTEYYKNQYADVTFHMLGFFFAGTNRVAPIDPNSYQQLMCKDVNSLHNRLMYPRDQLFYYYESKPCLEVFNQGGFVIGFQPNNFGTCTFYNYPYENLFNYVEGP